MVIADIDHWLKRFDLHAALHPHACTVVAALPAPVRTDLMEDPAFAMSDYEPAPGAGVCVRLGVPSGAAGIRPSRSVVLKRTLRHRPTPFIRWLIAHELAHAHLRNEGRWDGDDPEVAADALAAEWGFPKPPAIRR